MAQPSARKQIFAGACAKSQETLMNRRSPSISFVSSERPCLGLGKDQDERIETYISRVISEGAGSHSDMHFTKSYFGDEVQYSELDESCRRVVAAAQVHSQKWKISHTLGSVFSTNCQRNIITADKMQSLVCDQCLNLLKLDAFKKALRTKPAALKNLKFTPHRCRSAAINLGINLAKIEGVSDLLETVNHAVSHN